MNIIAQKIKDLQKKKSKIKHDQDIERLNKESEKAYIDQQIQAQKANELTQQKQEKQKEERKFIVAESKELCKKIYCLLKRTGIISSKQSYSACMGKAPSYWLMVECRQEQPVSITALKELKDNLYQVKNNLDLLMSDEDANYTLWVKQKLDVYIEELERQIMKIMRLIYGIVY